MQTLEDVSTQLGVAPGTLARIIETARLIAHECLDAALANVYVRDYIELGSAHLSTFDTREKRDASIRRHVPLRLMFEHGHCFTEAAHPGLLPGSWRGGKSGWGQFLGVAPLLPEDMYSPVRPGWVWTSGNDAFNRRMKLKALLGPFARTMVEDARRDPLHRFMKSITPEKQETLRLRTGLTPHEFWRAVKGRPILEPAPQQVELFEK
ncbi:MAG TPA: hypothetical protein VGH83_05635 [Candidatus Acidoferrum sp.]|jgi:hypothetical protein